MNEDIINGEKYIIIGKEDRNKKKSKDIPNKKPGKSPSVFVKMLFFFLGFLFGLIFIATFIFFSGFFTTIDYCNEKIDEASVISYNKGAFDIINYTASTGNLLYIENNELKETKCLN